MTSTFSIIQQGPYKNTAQIYENLFPAWQAPRGPFLMDWEDRVLNIHITPNEDGMSVSPGYDELSQVLRQYGTALLSISMSHWNTEKHQPRIVERHATLLFANIHRWKTLRIDAHLFNYILRDKQIRRFWQDIPPSNMRNLKIDQLHEAARGDISALYRFIERIFEAVNNQPFGHLDLDGSWIDAYVGLSPTDISILPFNNLRSLAITASISGDQAHEILAACGNTLEKVFISTLLKPNPEPTVQPARLKNLRVLKLLTTCNLVDEEVGSSFDLLRKIKTDYKLEELTLGYDDEWDSNAFAEFYRNSYTGNGCLPLRRLCLEKITINVRQFKACMDLNPSVSELVVDCHELDIYNGKTPMVVFTKHICKLFPDNYGSHLLRLVVHQERIERSGCFGRMITRLATDRSCSLGELIIIGENAESNLHPEDQKALKDLQKIKRGLFTLRYPGRVKARCHETHW